MIRLHTSLEARYGCRDLDAASKKLRQIWEGEEDEAKEGGGDEEQLFSPIYNHVDLC